jgi:hypothetical protein
MIFRQVSIRFRLVGRKTRRLPSTRERYSRRARATGKQIHREASVPVARSEDQRTYKAGLTGVLLLRNYLTVQRVSQRRARLDTVSLRKDVTRLTGEGCEPNKYIGHSSELVEHGIPFPKLDVYQSTLSRFLIRVLFLIRCAVAPPTHVVGRHFPNQ